MVVHGPHVGFPNAGQLVLEVSEVAHFGSSFLLSFSDVFVEIIQPFHDFFIGTYDNEQSAEKPNLRSAHQT